MNGIDWSVVFGVDYSGPYVSVMHIFWTEHFLPLMSWDIVKNGLGAVMAISMIGMLGGVLRRFSQRMG